VAAGYVAARQAVLGGLPPGGAAWPSPGAPGQMLALSINSSGYLLTELLLPFNRALFLWRPGVFGALTWHALPALAFLMMPVLLARPPGRGAGMDRSEVTGRKADFGEAAPRAAGLLVLLGWGWAVVFLMPFAGLAQFGPLGRLLYVPCLGLALLAAVAGTRLAAGRRGAGRVAFAVCLGWCVLMLPFLWQRIGWWGGDVTLFRRMARETPDYAPGLYNLGNALLAARDSAGAVAALRRAVALEPGLEPASLNLGALLLAGGELDEAAALYRSAVGRNPAYAPALVNLGIVRWRQGDTAGAIAELRRAVVLAPEDAPAAHNLAWLLRLTGEEDSARAWAERAFRLRPADPRIRRLYEQTR
jgi:Tfp pilus assembly protein PilF